MSANKSVAQVGGIGTGVPNRLRAVDVVAAYGKKVVVNGISIEVACGEIVALIGHNGAGKSTLLKAIFGMIPIKEGQLYLDGALVTGPIPSQMLARGVVYVPQGNRVFPDLTVYENLMMAGFTMQSRHKRVEGADAVLGVFPELRQHLKQRAGSLSGGEKQMLALASSMMLSPRLLLLDEPSLGLAPPLVSEALQRIASMCIQNGVAILIVEQKVREVVNIANRVYVLRNGQVCFSGQAEELRDECRLREVYF